MSTAVPVQPLLPAGFAILGVDELSSPAVVLWHEAMERNLARMIQIAGGPARLRPHVKTHKLAELVRWQVSQGTRKFKCATIAEAEMAASAGGTDILLAYPLLGPSIGRWIELVRAFPEVRWSALVDHQDHISALGTAAAAQRIDLEVLVDLDIGQHRTGVEPGHHAVALVEVIRQQPALRFAGLHAYDGHLHQRDLAERTAACEAAFAPVRRLVDALRQRDIEVLRVVAGGTPTFPIHARRPDVECSPGTCVLWDAGYAHKLPDLDFTPAAILVARVISRPAANRLCLDLGHKAVASEMPHPRVIFPEIPDAICVAHNEEHLVLETCRAAEFTLGTIVYGIPWHICPTMALHAEAWVAREGRVGECWSMTARARRLRY